MKTLEQRRGKGNLIALYRVQEGLEKLERQDLVEGEGRETRGNSDKLKKCICRRDVKKCSFPYRSIAIGNRLKEGIVCVRTIHEFRSKLDLERQGDRYSTSLVRLLSL